MKLQPIILRMIILGIIGSVGVGCSTAKIFPKPVENRRLGLIDRMNRMEPGNQSVAYSRRDSSKIVRMEYAHSKISRSEIKKLRGGSGKSSQDNSVPAKEVVAPQSGKFNWPLQSVKVTSLFGKRGKDFHEGIDLRAPSGTPVFASQSGVVLYADEHIKGYGKLIVIRHDPQIATIYAHNSELLVQRGDSVKKGQQISLSGNTGHSTGPHLHFEMRRGLAAVNPLKFLPSLGNVSRKILTRKKPSHHSKAYKVALK